MNKKYIFGGIIVAVFLVMMSFLFTQTNIQYATDFNTVMAKEKTYKAAGFWVKEKNYKSDNSTQTFSFFMADEKGKEMHVIFNGAIPNNFESAQSLVVTGKYKDGYFHATDILTKCPSKYEEEKTKVTTSSM